MNRHVGLLLSGGLDSSILLGRLIADGRSVRPLYVQGCLAWQPAELASLRRYLAALATPRLEPLVILDLPLADVYGNHWSITGRQPPLAGTADDAVYLPGRNALLTLKALLWCHLHGIQELALGILGTNPFADATPAFFEQFQDAVNAAIGGRVRIIRPLAGLDKRQVMQQGRGLPLELTFSCIAPVDEVHCGRCNKCAERRQAFALIGMPDPTAYASSPPS